MDDQNQREEVKIKDLLMKITVLKNGVLQERQKNGELEKTIQKLEKKIQNLDDVINEKEKEIINISNEKYHVQSKLDIERAKNDKTSEKGAELFMKRGSATGLSFNIKSDPEYIKLAEENVVLKLEADSLKRTLEEKKDDFEKCKDQYQALIKIQTDQIKKAEEDVLEKKMIIEDLNNKLNSSYERFKKHDIEKTKLEGKISDLTKENKILQSKIENLESLSDDKTKIIENYQESLMRHEKESASLARKLAELKNAIIESNIVIHSFKGEKIGSFFNKNIEIIFGRTDDDEYVMIIKEGSGEEYVAIDDIDYIKPGEKPNSYEICYMKNLKQVKVTMVMAEKNDKIIQVYKDYIHKSNLTKNNICY